MTRYRLYINNTDATDTWNVNLDEGAMDAIMAFRPNKEPVTNKNVTVAGAVVVCGTGLTDERTLSIPLHITANSYADFMAKRDAFFNVIKAGALEVKVKVVYDSVTLKKKDGSGYETVTPPADEVFSSTLYYVGSSNNIHFTWLPKKVFSEWEGNTRVWTENGGYGIAKFSLTFYEPNTPTL